MKHVITTFLVLLSFNASGGEDKGYRFRSTGVGSWPCTHKETGGIGRNVGFWERDGRITGECSVLTQEDFDELGNFPRAGLHLNGSVVDGVDLSGRKFIRAKMVAMKISNSNLSNADMNYVILDHTEIQDSDLRAACPAAR